MRPLVLLDYIESLSPQAALWRAIEPDVVWDLQAMLTALLIDEIRVLRWEFEKVNFKGKHKPPEQIPRPGVAPKEDKKTFGGRESALPIDQMGEWLGWGVGVPAGRKVQPRDARGRFVKAN